MGRPLRVSAGGYVYHVLNRANARLPLFHKYGDYAAFHRVLAGGRGKRKGHREFLLVSFAGENREKRYQFGFAADSFISSLPDDRRTKRVRERAAASSLGSFLVFAPLLVRFPVCTI